MRAYARTSVALAVAFALIACAPNMAYALTKGVIDGSRAPCQNEGEEVTVDSIKDMSCFKCICKNGFIECEQEQCPDVRHCYTQMPKEGCCVKCKGCVYKGTIHASDTEWRDPADPCRILRCEAGVVTESTMHCYTPCENIRPPAPGQCCPSCQGKILNNRNQSVC
ncbi:BMP-binding endothelial regulator protein-like [Arctopsyche grandis]|uniref:BMP-binding endothelial regulator protein-like n=1 Tax=Arctopsyche grandis TaxID=121162 RepID=UPI00406D6BF4